MLTGVAVTIAPGSLIQLVISLAVLVVYAVAVTQCRPYRNGRDNILALVLYAVLAVTLLIGLLLKIKDGYESNGKLCVSQLDSATLLTPTSALCRKIRVRIHC
jgi:hypothetical protein